MTCSPLASNKGITLDQLEPSAHAPWMRSTFFTPPVGTVCAVILALERIARRAAQGTIIFRIDFNICIVLLLNEERSTRIRSLAKSVQPGQCRRPHLCCRRHSAVLLFLETSFR